MGVYYISKIPTPSPGHHPRGGGGGREIHKKKRNIPYFYYIRLRKKNRFGTFGDSWMKKLLWINIIPPPPNFYFNYFN